tara:strand:+ start:12744 stop:13259 length:516 start_codon:yes stop_codon:yes gene_type:complete
MTPQAGKAPPVFGFESDFAGSLRCIPMAVRQKLDLVGIKLTLRQWSRLGAVQRQALLLEPCGDAGEIAGYGAALRGVLERMGEVAAPVTADIALWQDRADVPAIVVSQAQAKGTIAPTIAQWRRLTPLQRFAIIKLARPGHENENFLPAMVEFGLVLPRNERRAGAAHLAE